MRKRILMVDDEPFLREIYASELRTLGYEVIEASDGTDAIEQLQMPFNEFFAVITDLMMPKLMGDQLIKEIQDQKINIQVLILMSSMPNIDQIVSHLSQHIPQTRKVSSFPKSADPNDLIILLEQAITALSAEKISA